MSTIGNPLKKSLVGTGRDLNKNAPWYVPATLSLLPNIIAGLIVAALLIFASTTSHILLLIALIIVFASITSAVIVELRNKKLREDLRVLQDELDRCGSLFEEQLRHVGITEITSSMEGSRWSPEAVMDRATREVRFIGVFGHKWVMDSSKQNKFQDMLTKIQLNGGRAQFLLLSPKSVAAQQLASYRKLEVHSYEGFPSIEFYKQMAERFECFEVRLFENFPFIRLLFVDGVCAVSRFKIHAAAEDTLKAPQLAFAPEEPSNPWTMYQAFVLLYDFLWGKGIDPFVAAATLKANQIVVEEERASPSNNSEAMQPRVVEPC